MRTTKRGLRIYGEVSDLYGTRVRIQASSVADEDAVWIFSVPCQDGSMSFLSDKPVFLHPHLSIAQAKRVIEALQLFIDEHARP